MINELRKLLQTNLKTIQGLSCGRAKADDVIEEDEIYYGYELTYSVDNSSLGYEYNEYSITLTGRLVSKNKSWYRNEIVCKEAKLKHINISSKKGN